MSDAGDRTVDLGEVRPAGSRQLGRRSAVCRTGDAVVAGLADGTVVAVDADTDTDGDALDERWRSTGGERGSVVSLTPFAGGVLAGERGADGELRLHDAATGTVRWRYRTADDVGAPSAESRFLLPFVADAAAGDGRAYVAARRYERDAGGGRTFRSVVCAFGPGGRVEWRYAADASPVALDAADGAVAVGYNRCPGEHADGVVVLDAATGAVRRRWDPPGGGSRRVGDVAFAGGALALASHADYRGYLLDGDGPRWAVDLGRPVERGDETVYAYPNHVHAGGDGAVFVTGNTYPEDGRETEARHPNEHAAVGVGPDGERRWTAPVGGFAHEIAADGDAVAVPVAQHFRERDAAVHGIRRFSVGDGPDGSCRIPGAVTAAALDGRIAAVEEPVAYHDGDDVHGAYRLHC